VISRHTCRPGGAAKIRASCSTFLFVREVPYTTLLVFHGRRLHVPTYTFGFRYHSFPGESQLVDQILFLHLTCSETFRTADELFHEMSISPSVLWRCWLAAGRASGL